MKILEKIKDPKLLEIIDSVPLGNKEEFRKVIEKFSNYDPSFLWLVSYSREDVPMNRSYVEAGYKKFHQILDQDFPRILATKGNFISRMWELVLCDVLSSSGEFIPKNADGADFQLKSANGQLNQIEAVAPDEAKDESLRANRPDYSKSNFYQFGGSIHDMELPIVLRTLQAVSDKKSGYSKELPLIIAINTSKVVGTISNDDYVLRRILFGLGNLTLTINGDDYKKGLEQLPSYNKPGQKSFPVAFFRNPEFSYISGIIYTSQNPLSLIPGGYGWHNSGITFVQNPMASHPTDLEFPFFKRIQCSEEKYEELEPSKKFRSVLSEN